MKNKIAVVIPYYKMDFFEQTLESLQNQSNRNFNLYIGNDNSPHDPHLIIDKYDNIITKYKKFDTNVGGVFLSKQWERCIDELVKDENWVMLLADDDIISENYIEEFYNNIEEAEKNNITLIKYKCKIIDENNTIIKEFQDHPSIGKSTKFFGNLFFNNGISTLSENVFKIDKYKKYGYKNLELAYGSDIIAVLEFSEFGNILFINNAYMSFRYSKVNISGNRNSEIMKIKKMKGNAGYMIYLLSKYGSKFDYDTKVEMCKKLYRNFRVVYRQNLLKNLYCFFLIFKNVKIIDVKNIVKNGGR